MEITVLVDNNTLTEPYFLAEAGLSLLIQDKDTSVLFDVGYSDVFLKNAFKLRKKLTDLDYLVLSHNHLDHTWGLEPFIRYLTELQLEQHPFKRPTLVAHPEVFVSVSGEGYTEIGSLLSEKKLEKHFSVKLSSQPLALSDKLTFLGAIPRRNDFEGEVTLGRKEGAAEEDHVIDDSALVYKSAAGLIIMTGCSHAGICNIIEYAKEKAIDEIIIGIKRRSKVGKLLFGSNAQYIIIKAPCPVVTIK